MKVRPGDSKLFQIVHKWKGEKLPPKSFAILGVPDDRGVAVSKGRVGAKKGPEAIRKELYKMTLGVHGELERVKLWDLGNLRLERTQEATYEKLKGVVFQLLDWDVFPIILGGGHDLSFGSLSGFLQKYPKGGIVNVDAHLDARPPEAKGEYSSGTAFWQLLEKGSLKGKNLLEFGFHSHCNSKKHFEYLQKQGVKLVAYSGRFQKSWKQFGHGRKEIALSFDMDCVCASDSPGVSAPQVVGYKAEEALRFVQIAASSQRLILFEVMETNPSFDLDNRSSKLAARLIFTLFTTALAV